MPPQPLQPEGLHAITATATTEANGESAPTGPFDLVIDTTAPANGGIDTVLDDVGTIQDPVQNGGATDDSTPTLVGKGTPGDVVTVIANGNTLGSTTVGDNGEWSFTPETPLPDNTYEFKTVITDPAGNASGLSDPYIVIVDTAAPEVPVITSIVDDVGTITGEISNGGATDDKRPTVNGTAPANTVVIIYDNGNEVGSTRANSQGMWSFPLTSDLSDTLHHITASTRDDVGNTSEQSNEWNIVVDTQIDTPTITSAYDDVGKVGEISNGGRTDDTTPTLSGKAEPHSTVTIYDGTTEIGTAIADDNGDWSFITPVRDIGDHDFTVIAEDEAGNVSDRSESWSFYIGPIGTENGSESFESETAGTLDQGFHHFSSGLDIEIIDIGNGSNPQYANAIYRNTQYGNTTKQMSLATNSIVKLLFDDTTKVSFDYGAVNAAEGGTVSFYDASGKLLGTITLTQTLEFGDDGDLIDDFPHSALFTAPEGETIAYAMIEVKDPSNNGFSNVGFDNIKWGSDVDVTATFAQTNDNAITEQHHEAGAEILLDANAQEDEGQMQHILVVDHESGVMQLSLDSVLESGAEGLFIDDDSQQLLIKGEAGDKIELSDLLKDGTDTGDWKQVAGTVTVAGEKYEVYQHSGAEVELLVQQGVQVDLLNH
jgi:hypothetical protein